MLEWLNTFGFELAIVFTVAGLFFRTVITSRRVDTLSNALKRLHEAVWEHDNE